MLYLSKLLTQLVFPLNLCLLLGPLGLLLAFWGWRWLGGGLVIFGFAWLLLWSLPMASFGLRAGLERQYPQRAMADYPQVAAAVVLAGGSEGLRRGWRDGPSLAAGSDRVWLGARLFHAQRAPLVILSGGLVEWSHATRNPAEAMARYIEELGVPAAALLLERQSRNTYENALFTAQLLRERGIGRVLLVTSALHMPRAVALFQKQGVDVVPAPTDAEALPPRGSWRSRWWPDARALQSSNRAFKEYLGIWVYRLFGLAVW